MGQKMRKQAPTHTPRFFLILLVLLLCVFHTVLNTPLRALMPNGQQEYIFSTNEHLVTVHEIATRSRSKPASPY